MTDIGNSNHISTGDFPFPLETGSHESPHLVWLRNNSNYMITRGAMDYLRIVAVLVRGIAINLLILATPVLIISVLLSVVYFNLTNYYALPDKVDITVERTDSGLLNSVSQFEFTTIITRNDGERTRPVITTGDPAKVLADVAEQHVRDISIFAASNGSGGSLFNAFSWLNLRDKAQIRVTDAKSNDVHFVSLSDIANADGSVIRDFTIKASRSPILRLTIWALVGAVVLVLLFPVFARLYRVAIFKPNLEFDPGGSVTIRDVFERIYGYALLFIILLMLLEAFPVLLVHFHKFRAGAYGVAVPTLATIAGAVIAANRVLPMLGGYARKLAVLVVGALGLLIPLLGLLYVTEFLVFTDPVANNHSLVFWLLVLPVLFVVGVLFALVLGLIRGTIGKRGFFRLFRLAAFMALMFLIVWIFSSTFLRTSLGVVAQGSELFRYSNYFVVIGWAIEIWVFCRVAVDINLTSISGLYRDRLVQAFLVGKSDGKDVEVKKDVNMHEICNYDARSEAPYHLINAALNLQGSDDPSIRDRNSDFFVFSRKFIGSNRTGYCRSECMELAFPQMDLGTAMAISAAAASPNMGRGTNPLMVALMTLLNVRLGYWIPNPGRLAAEFATLSQGIGRAEARALSFHGDVFPAEFAEINKRWTQVYGANTGRPTGPRQHPSTAHNLVGIGFSGGGIRSATLNLGIVQALYQAGVFPHIDYMSTVSGGGYLGSSISAAMRHKTAPHAEFDGVASRPDPDAKTVTVTPNDGEAVDYVYAESAKISERIDRDPIVKNGQWLLDTGGDTGVSLIDVLDWRVRPKALQRELFSQLDETHRWVNLSDGGHIENMATIELLRRRCRFIIIGDGEADSELHFNGLATLVRYARIDMGIKIDIDVGRIRPQPAEGNGKPKSNRNWAWGKISYYPDDKTGAGFETGYLLYLKSSITGGEDPVVEEYRDRNPDFPHETTADQLFDEGQFEAYRALGEFIAKSALEKSAAVGDGHEMSFENLEKWFETELPQEVRSTGDGTKAPKKRPARQQSKKP